MKIRIQKAKFIRNIIIGIIALIIVAFIINIAPGFKRNKYQNVVNLVIGDENITEKLKNPIYMDEENTIYISKDDVKELFDKTLYYDEQMNMMITTSEVSVASMIVGEKSININGSNVHTLDTIIYNDNIMYIPIQEMEAVYNIDMQYIESENVVIIDSLNKGMIKAEANEETDIRFKPRGLSKKVGALSVGDTVSAFYTTSKGWRLIRTQDGIIGYVKANILTNEYIVRQDMEQKVTTKEITANLTNNSIVNVEGNSILIKDLLLIVDDEILLRNKDFTKDDITGSLWANLTINDANLEEYENRTELIKNIVTISMKNGIKGINIKSNGDENVERFTIELVPRLREIGIVTNIVKTDETDTEKYKDIVNYIISEEE